MNNLSAQRYGPLLERYIQLKFDYIKNKATVYAGDCRKGGRNFEIKVSMGGVRHNKFNFVQLRPGHKCNGYILTAYYLNLDNVNEEGCLYIFVISNNEMKELIVKHGGYAHGSVKQHGPITTKTVFNSDNVKEYALRTTVNDKCWSDMIKFKVDESSL